MAPARLVEELAERVAAVSVQRRGWVRVAVDSAPAGEPDRLAADLVEALHRRGHPALHVAAAGFHRPASLRLERGRTNPDAYYEDWLDLGALQREVVRPLGAGGTGRVLPSLRDPLTDRASRAGYLTLPPGGAVVVSGALLLGAGLDFDLTVHLAVSAAALGRRTAAELAWTLPAFARYAEEVRPAELADVVVRADDLRHPAVVEA